MFIVDSYALAVVFCFVTMLCWGSWGNTQKMAAKTWRYELFYWDYVIGMFLFALILSLTMGSFGSEGRPFLQDLGQASGANITSALLGGVIFNASNILLSASTALAGMAVAFPLGVGLALVLGVIINYAGAPKGDPVILFVGVALIVAAIVCNGIASGRMQKGAGGNSNSRKGIVLAMVAGVLLSNFVFNTCVMKRPFVGAPVSYREYFTGSGTTHLVGMLGGAVWCLGTAFSYIAAGKAGAAISYALGQGAPMIAAVWGVFIWKEFKGADRSVNTLLGVMFLFFIAGLGLIILSGGN